MTPPIAPATAEQAAAYQRLRGHLAALKLSTAAEHLPAVLDAARAERLTVTVTAAAALLDRLLHRSVVINLDGASYRLREHQARNETLRATTTRTRQPLPRRPAGEEIHRATLRKISERHHLWLPPAQAGHPSRLMRGFRQFAP